MRLVTTIAVIALVAVTAASIATAAAAADNKNMFQQLEESAAALKSSHHTASPSELDKLVTHVRTDLERIRARFAGSASKEITISQALLQAGQALLSVQHSHAHQQEGVALLEEALKMRKQHFKKDDQLVANALEALGIARGSSVSSSSSSSDSNNNNLMEALALKTQALEMRRRLYGERADRHDIAASLVNVGKSQIDLHEYHRAVRTLIAATSMYRRLNRVEKKDDESATTAGEFVDLDTLDLATALETLALALEKHNQLDAALGKRKEALNMRRRIFGRHNDDASIARACFDIGMLLDKLHSSKNYAAAIAFLRESLTISQRMHSKRGGDGEASSRALAHAEAEIGHLFVTKYKQVAEGLELLEKSVAAYREALRLVPASSSSGTASSSTTKLLQTELATALQYLGTALLNLGQGEKALTAQEESLQLRRQVYDDAPHHELATSLINVGASLAAQGDTAEAITHLKEAYKMQKSLLAGKLDRDFANFVHTLGTSLAEQPGHAEESAAFLEEAAAMFQQLNDHVERKRRESNIEEAIETNKAHQAFVEAGKAEGKYKQDPPDDEEDL